MQHKKVVAKLFRSVLDYLKKPAAAQEHIFWSILSLSALFVRWVCRTDQLCASEGYRTF